MIVGGSAPRGASDWLARLGRHQLGSLLATGADWAVMIALVELLAAGPVLATALGAAVGGVIAFGVGRRWVFGVEGRLSGQAARYASVWAVSVALNAAGERALLPVFGSYLAARFVVATLVGVLWNFEMGRRWVFRAEAT
ncbi:MAG: GtrA family protein [Deltaproteobacteria bacterium]|nr:GtrA family protein [Deltaproteobacteria bacterium]